MACSVAGVDSSFPIELLVFLLKPHPWRRREWTTNLHTPYITATCVYTVTSTNINAFSTNSGVQIFNINPSGSTVFRASFLGGASATTAAAGVQDIVAITAVGHLVSFRYCLLLQVMLRKVQRENKKEKLQLDHKATPSSFNIGFSENLVRSLKLITLMFF